jgi:hypothetical protein
LFIAAMAVSSPVWASATLQSVSPQVSVNRGQGYEQVKTASAELSTGDQVMAGPGGRAKIVYPDGCVTNVNPGAVVTVGKCYEPMRAGLEAPVEEARPVPWFPIVAGAAIVTVGLCAASGCFDHEHHKPRSP